MDSAVAGYCYVNMVARHFSLGRSRWSLDGGLRLAAHERHCRSSPRSARGISKLPPHGIEGLFHREDDPAEAASGFHGAVSVGGVLEREDPVDDGGERAGGEGG